MSIRRISIIDSSSSSVHIGCERHRDVGARLLLIAAATWNPKDAPSYRTLGPNSSGKQVEFGREQQRTYYRLKLSGMKLACGDRIVAHLHDQLRVGQARPLW